ncbi:MAG: GAF domain-containing protein, partial [Gammaproteobacteria bacterium]|nr:GAF domain-containing protein [Gammaproteobacteria bacterium]
MTVDAEHANTPPRHVLTEVYIRLCKDPQVWSEDLCEALNVITRTCADALAVARVSVWRLQGDQVCCLNLYRRDWRVHEQGETLDVALLPAYFRTLSQHRLIQVTEALHDARTRPLVASYLAPLGIQSLLDATLRVGGECVGVFSAEAVGEIRHWTDDEQHFLASVADLVSQ